MNPSNNSVAPTHEERRAFPSEDRRKLRERHTSEPVGFGTRRFRCSVCKEPWQEPGCSTIRLLDYAEALEAGTGAIMIENAELRDGLERLRKVEAAAKSLIALPGYVQPAAFEALENALRESLLPVTEDAGGGKEERR